MYIWKLLETVLRIYNKWRNFFLRKSTKSQNNEFVTFGPEPMSIFSSPNSMWPELSQRNTTSSRCSQEGGFFSPQLLGLMFCSSRGGPVSLTYPPPPSPPSLCHKRCCSRQVYLTGLVLPSHVQLLFVWQGLLLPWAPVGWCRNSSQEKRQAARTENPTNTSANRV